MQSFEQQAVQRDPWPAQQEQYISSLYPHLMRHFVRAKGADWNEIFALLEDCADDTYRYGQHMPLAKLDVILEKVLQKPGGQAFGLQVGASVHPSDYGVIGYALMNCSTLGEALGFAAQHKHAFNPGMEVSLKDNGAYSLFRVRNALHSPHAQMLVEMDFAAAIELARFLVGQQLRDQVTLQGVRFMHQAKARLEDYQEVFLCPVHFGQQDNAMQIPREVLQLPIRSANPQLLHSYLRKAQRIKQARFNQISVSARVAQFVGRSLAQGLPDLKETSQALHMGVSTLKHKLAREGTCYREVCDRVLQEKAELMLAKPGLRLKELAFHLGFSSQAAFTRAYKRWTGQSPQQRRRELVQSEV